MSTVGVAAPGSVPGRRRQRPSRSASSPSPCSERTMSAMLRPCASSPARYPAGPPDRFPAPGPRRWLSRGRRSAAVGTERRVAAFVLQGDGAAQRPVAERQRDPLTASRPSSSAASARSRQDLCSLAKLRNLQLELQIRRIEPTPTERLAWPSSRPKQRIARGEGQRQCQGTVDGDQVRVERLARTAPVMLGRGSPSASASCPDSSLVPTAPRRPISAGPPSCGSQPGVQRPQAGPVGRRRPAERFEEIARLGRRQDGDEIGEASFERLAHRAGHRRRGSGGGELEPAAATAGSPRNVPARRTGASRSSPGGGAAPDKRKSNLGWGRSSSPWNSYVTARRSAAPRTPKRAPPGPPSASSSSVTRPFANPAASRPRAARRG